MIQPSSTLLNATVERLARDGVPLAVQAELPDAVHLWPLRPVDTWGYVHARWTFMALTDGRIVWHDPVSAA